MPVGVGRALVECEIQLLLRSAKSILTTDVHSHTVSVINDGLILSGHGQCSADTGADTLKKQATCLGG